MKIMLRVLAAAALALIISNPASAQSVCKYISQDSVLTASQWNYCFQQKQDGLGYSPVNQAGDVLTGKLTTMAPSASVAGFSLPPGVDPTAPHDGDIWTTSSGLFVRIGGVTIGPIGTASTLANRVYAGPTSGGAAPPAFRALVAADLPLATSSAFGAIKPDNTTVSISSGVLSAIGASATTIQSGVTNFTSATNTNCAYNNSGVLGNKPCITQVKIQSFNTASGAFTYTPTAGMMYAKVECVGAGGGGGGANAASGTTAGGGGGGSGAYSTAVLTAAQIGASKAGSIGTGGTGTTGAGGTGGDTNLDTLCVAKGGGGGQQATSSGANGALGGLASGGTGDVKFDGNGGGGGVGSSGTSTIAMGGAGAGSFFGGGGAGLTLSGGGRAAAACGGGGGGATITGAASNAGGVGFRGCVIVTEFINQ